MAHSVQIYYSVNGKYQVNLPAVNSILDKAGKRPVAVYSICGPLRKGKSFLLSICLRYLITQGHGDWVNHNLKNMFIYRPGTDRETIGIYMWSEPFILSKSDGSEIALLLLDSQGSFDAQTTMQENAIVFALCTLLSSHLIFNLSSQISEDLLQFIQYFGGYARLAEEENQDEPFQKLLFLIRDFEQPDYKCGYYDDSNSDINGKNYKKAFLDPKETQPMEVKFVHEMILSTFINVGVYLMPHPGKQLATNGIFNTTTVDKEFLDHLKKLIPFLFNVDNIIIKQIGGAVVTGVHLKALVNKWGTILNSDKMPESKSVFQATAEIQHEMGKAAALDNYSRRFKEVLKSGNKQGLTEDVLNDIHSQVESESMKLFKSFTKIGAANYSENYIKLIKEDISNIFEYYKQINATNVEMAKVTAETDVKLAELNRQVDVKKKELEDVKETNKEEKQSLIENHRIAVSKRDDLQKENNQKILDLEYKLNQQQIAINNAKKKGKKRRLLKPSTW